MKEQILALLRQNKDYVSGAEISRSLGVSRSAVWKAIEQLRREGYKIDSVTNRGYRLTRVTNQLQLREILSNLPEDHPWKDSILYFSSIESTNNRAKELAAAGAPSGTVLIADCQTGGRGRRGRSFLSPARMGIYLSVILRPKCSPEKLMHLTCAVAVAMCNAIEDAAGFRPEIKWTNDLVKNGKKLSGILTELALEAESGQVEYAVSGIGINCRQQECDFPPEIRTMAGSVEMIAGHSIDRNVLAAAMIRRLKEMDDALLSGKDGIMAQYRADCMTVGQHISLLRADEIRHGTAIDIDDSGALIVEFENGTAEAVSSGEVSIRGMYGYV